MTFNSSRMSRNLDPRIDAYIAKSAPFAQPILKHLRALVHRGCPDVIETMKWSCPHFEYAGKLLCHMAAFKEHCGFGFWHQAMEKITAELGPVREEAMGLFGRITRLEDLPKDEVLLRFVSQAAKLNETGVPGRPRPKSSGGNEPALPPDLAAALKKSKSAAKAFAEFRPSYRKEYINWITDAKRPETRKQRLATTVEWVAEGKPRNWKYINC
jgi:uncharacterized protein YdeI (YjbR/CyaY-like superfamily)